MVVETADVVLMRSDPLDVARAVRLGRATVTKMKQNLAWAIGYNSLAIPLVAGLFYPTFGWLLQPAIGALLMSGSSVLVAVNAVLLRRTALSTRSELDGTEWSSRPWTIRGARRDRLPTTGNWRLKMSLRQPESENRAALRPVFGVDRAVMGLHQLAGDGQPQARTTIGPGRPRSTR